MRDACADCDPLPQVCLARVNYESTIMCYPLCVRRTAALIPYFLVTVLQYYLITLLHYYNNTPVRYYITSYFVLHYYIIRYYIFTARCGG